MIGTQEMRETFPTIRDEITDACRLIRETVEKKFKDKKIFVTSSFQTHSIPLLHILSQIDNSLPVYFLNTGYHFPETLSFKDQVSALLGLTTIDLFSSLPKNHQRDSKGNLLFASDPDYCCYLNKIQPTELLLRTYDVWVSGVRGDQTASRKTLHVMDQGPFDTIRYHPMLKWTSEQVDEYIKMFNLPSHPLEYQGYSSIGCMPCTRKTLPNLGNVRDARWIGLTKTECGLHTELVRKP